jgi:hypothetical protein
VVAVGIVAIVRSHAAPAGRIATDIRVDFSPALQANGRYATGWIEDDHVKVALGRIGGMSTVVDLGRGSAQTGAVAIDAAGSAIVAVAASNLPVRAWVLRADGAVVARFTTPTPSLKDVPGSDIYGAHVAAGPRPGSFILGWCLGVGHASVKLFTAGRWSATARLTRRRGCPTVAYLPGGTPVVAWDDFDQEELIGPRSAIDDRLWVARVTVAGRLADVSEIATGRELYLYTKAKFVNGLPRPFLVGSLVGVAGRGGYLRFASLGAHGWGRARPSPVPVRASLAGLSDGAVVATWNTRGGRQAPRLAFFGAGRWDVRAPPRPLSAAIVGGAAATGALGKTLAIVVADPDRGLDLVTVAREAFARHRLGPETAAVGEGTYAYAGRNVLLQWRSDRQGSCGWDNYCPISDLFVWAGECGSSCLPG